MPTNTKERIKIDDIYFVLLVYSIQYIFTRCETKNAKNCNRFFTVNLPNRLELSRSKSKFSVGHATKNLVLGPLIGEI